VAEVVVVTGSRIARRDKQISAERLTALQMEKTEYDPAARLRAAAASGHTAEIQDLLAHGVPVDAPDTDGDTALMQSIQADQPSAAALLRRRGASLDQKNLAGVSARDMATARDDPELDRALGLGP
jgi:ankyrin repeat protein